MCDRCRDETEIIETYFWDGFNYKTIVRFLREYHAIDMSFSTLRRRLSNCGLSRKRVHPPLATVVDIIREELQGPGVCYSNNIHIVYWLATTLSAML